VIQNVQPTGWLVLKAEDLASSDNNNLRVPSMARQDIVLMLLREAALVVGLSMDTRPVGNCDYDSPSITSLETLDRILGSGLPGIAACSLSPIYSDHKQHGVCTSHYNCKSKLDTCGYHTLCQLNPHLRILGSTVLVVRDIHVFLVAISDTHIGCAGLHNGGLEVQPLEHAPLPSMSYHSHMCSF